MRAKQTRNPERRSSVSPQNTMPSHHDHDTIETRDLNRRPPACIGLAIMIMSLDRVQTG